MIWPPYAVIFKVYDSDCNGKVSFNDILEVLRDLSGPFMSDEQREVFWSTSFHRICFGISRLNYHILVALSTYYNFNLQSL